MTARAVLFRHSTAMVRPNPARGRAEARRNVPRGHVAPLPPVPVVVGRRRPLAERTAPRPLRMGVDLPPHRSGPPGPSTSHTSAYRNPGSGCVRFNKVCTFTCMAGLRVVSPPMVIRTGSPLRQPCFSLPSQPLRGAGAGAWPGMATNAAPHTVASPPPSAEAGTNHARIAPPIDSHPQIVRRSRLFP